MADLREGVKAPEISLLDDSGNPFRLSDLQGRNVVLYFYPRADTPGCTREACDFRDRLPAIEKQDAAVVGVSPDSVAAVAKFKAKFHLDFPLLADQEHQAAETYGVWKEKNLYGKKSMGVERTTFVVGKDGRIAKVFPKVKVEGHAAAVMDVLKNL